MISTHPNTRTRPGPVTDEHPDGIYPVARGALPVTLGDVASDFANIGERFGPYARDGVTHPGFVSGETRASVLTEDFALTVRANANALPYKGIDLTDGSSASVNSVRSQIQALFDFDDPNWLRVEGLVQGIPRSTLSLSGSWNLAPSWKAGAHPCLPESARHRHGSSLPGHWNAC